jgi:hypothetical protein
MKRLCAAIALVWISLLPPLFTDGTCSRESEQANALVFPWGGFLHWGR